MKFVVIGANGFIGSCLINKLLNAGHNVLALDFSFDKLNDSNLLIKQKVDSKNMNNLIDKYPSFKGSVFFNFAWRGVNGVEKSDPYVQLENIKNLLLFADFAKKIGAKKYICSGTIAEESIKSLPNIYHANGGMMYSTSKFTGRFFLETYCKIIGLDFIWLQFSNIFGPSNKTGNLISYTLGNLSKNLPAIFGPANQPYDFLYIDDLLDALYRVGTIDLRNNFYFVGSGSPRILKEYLLQIGKLLNKENLILIGQRQDDGIVYNFDMLNAQILKDEIGEYVKNSFEDDIIFTFNSYKGDK